MSTDNLIDQLTNDLEPVKRLESPLRRLLRWLAVSSLCIVVGVFVMGLRHDLSNAIYSTSFWLETSLILASAISASLLAFLLSVPGRTVKKIKLAPSLCIALWGLTILVLSLRKDVDSSHLAQLTNGMPCMSAIYSMAVIPGALLFAMICNAAPLNKPLVGIWAVIAAAAFGALGLQFVCASSNPIHLIIWHVLPVLAIGVVGIYLGKLVFNWDNKT